jgi:subtilisin family serine protease
VKRFVIIATGLLALGVQPVWGQDAYVDPVLRRLLDPEQRSALLADPAVGLAPRSADAPAEILALRREGAADPVRVGAFLRLRSPQAEAELRALGVEIGTIVGDIATAWIPVDALDEVVRSPAAVVIEAARTVRVEHDISMVAVRADRVRGLQDGRWVGSTGENVYVGIYDTGIDFRHQDFIDADGRTRIAAILDQTRGVTCTREQIQAAIDGASAACPQQDIHGHGTHVAGTAAGDGSAGATPFRYAGVAPNAELLIVKGGDGSFFENMMADGLAWMADFAEQRGRPLVVNYSIGGQHGPHDGTRLFELFVDQRSGPGVIVVTSAGNDGTNYNTTCAFPGNPGCTVIPVLRHARGIPRQTVPAEVTFEIGSYTPIDASCSNFVLFNMWYSGADQLRITVVRPNGSSFAMPHGAVDADVHQNGRIYIDNASRGPHPINFDHEVEISVDNCGMAGPPMPGAWRIRVEPQTPPTGAPFDVWMYFQQMGFGGLVTGVSGFDNRFVVSSPGNARRVITVGAFATKMCWPSVARQDPPVCFVLQEEIGDIARFSSAGPTRDGRMKPDIAAPGIGVFSSMSGSILPPENVRDPGGAHWMNAGTSMAAPHVTGTVALMLERRPALTPEDIRDAFARTAAQDMFTMRTYGPFAGGTPQDWWGLGKLDVEAAVGFVANGMPAVRIVIVPQRDTLPAGATLQLRADVLDEQDRPTFARPAWTSTNPDVAAVDDDGLVTALAPGTGLIIASVQTLSDTATIVVVPPAVLTVTTASAAPDSPVRAPAGTRLPLLAVRLAAAGHEAIEVRQLGFDVEGNDPAARVLLFHDIDGSGTLSAADTLLATVQVALTPAPRRVIVATPGLEVPRDGVVDLLLAVEVSGQAPSATEFRARLVPEELKTRGVRSGMEDLINLPTAPIASQPAVTTLLAPGQLFSLSENPVRQNELILNFRERPTAVAVYTLAGARVADLRQRLDGDTRIRWNLRNDEDARIAPGVYLLHVEVGGERIRERLFIMNAAPVGAR